MDRILLDTSFCLRLLIENDPLHENAVDYFKHFLENKKELYLSSIVIAEFCVKNSIENFPTETTKILPFGYDDAICAGDFYNIVIQNNEAYAGINRAVVKNDVNLIAQMHCNKIDSYATSDTESFKKFFTPINKARGTSIQFIDIHRPLNEFLGKLF